MFVIQADMVGRSKKEGRRTQRHSPHVNVVKHTVDDGGQGVQDGQESSFGMSQTTEMIIRRTVDVEPRKAGI